MVAAIVAAGLLAAAPQASVAPTAAECAFLRAVLVAQWPLEPPGSQEIFYLDPQARGRTIFLEEGFNTPLVVDAAFVAELFPQVAAVAAEFVPYFQERSPYQISCDFGALSVTPAATSREGALDDQESLQFPRISLSQPIISSDGRFAIGGFAWSFSAGYWLEDDCIFERAEDEWRMVECNLYPLER